MLSVFERVPRICNKINKKVYNKSFSLKLKHILFNMCYFMTLIVMN